MLVKNQQLHSVIQSCCCTSGTKLGFAATSLLPHFLYQSIRSYFSIRRPHWRPTPHGKHPPGRPSGKKLRQRELERIWTAGYRKQVARRKEQELFNLYRSWPPKKEDERYLDQLNGSLEKQYRAIESLRQKLKKYELKESPVEVHDPEMLTQERMHNLSSLSAKHPFKNFFTVGKRGIFQGTIEDIHMHWKYHETVRMDCRIFPMEGVKALAEEAAKLSGGVVIDILPNKSVILYRGANYEPHVERVLIKNSLNKNEAFRKCLYEQQISSRLKHINTLKTEVRLLEEKIAVDKLRSCGVDTVRVHGRTKGYLDDLEEESDGFHEDTESSSDTDWDELTPLKRSPSPLFKYMKYLEHKRENEDPITEGPMRDPETEYEFTADS